MTHAPASVDDATTAEAEDAAPAADISPLGRAFAVIALLEAFTWAGLLIGMFLKHVTGTTEAGVWLFGRLHGGVFLVYVLATLVAAVGLRWRWWVALIALLASIPPLVTVPLEIWLRRTGRLVRRPRA
jgi:integral membrane protein